MKSNAGYVAAYKMMRKQSYRSEMYQNNKGLEIHFKLEILLRHNVKTQKIFVNNRESETLGALGNTWESFYLSPGENTIRVLTSDWSEIPETQLLVREVWL